MRLNITKQRQLVEEKSYKLFYERIDMRGAGFAFPCDERGVLEPMLPMAQSSYEECQLGGYHPPYIQTFVHRHHEPAEGLCECGRTVYLEDPMDNECESCGRNYNMAGQEVIPMSLCRDHDDY